MRRLLTASAALVIVVAAVLLAARSGRVFWFANADAPITYAPDDGQPTIVCLGDSLTAGNDAPRDQSYPAWLQQKLDHSGYRWRVVNAGVSGNRVADGLARLRTDVLPFHPAIAIVELGSNDPGHTPVQQWEAGLDAIVSRLQSRHIRIILGGLDYPGMGDVYRAVAARYGVPLVWFTAQVAQHPDMWGPDGHHPNGQGYRLVMEAFWTALKPMLGPPSV